MSGPSAGSSTTSTRPSLSTAASDSWPWAGPAGGLAGPRPATSRLRSWTDPGGPGDEDAARRATTGVTALGEGNRIGPAIPVDIAHRAELTGQAHMRRPLGGRAEARGSGRGSRQPGGRHDQRRGSTSSGSQRQQRLVLAVSPSAEGHHAAPHPGSESEVEPHPETPYCPDLF